MAINRSQLAKELEPGLNALFGLEYAQYGMHYSDQSTHNTRTNMLRFTTQRLLTELLKKK